MTVGAGVGWVWANVGGSVEGAAVFWKKEGVLVGNGVGKPVVGVIVEGAAVVGTALGANVGIRVGKAVGSCEGKTPAGVGGKVGPGMFPFSV